MKKIYLIFGVITFLFYSCDSDINVNTDYEEITVIMGLLDQSQSIQYVQVTKTFLGDDPAPQMATDADNFHYNPDSLLVELHEINSSGDTVDSRVLKDTIFLKDVGDFAIDNNIVYYLETPTDYDDPNILDVLRSDRNYVITVLNIQTNNTATSNTGIIGNSKWRLDGGNRQFLENYEFFQANDDVINFYNLENGVNNATPRKPRWDPEKNPGVAIYQPILIFNYFEDGIEKSLEWRLAEKQAEDSDVTMNAAQFWNFLSSADTLKSNLPRTFKDISIEITLGSQDLKTYMLVNEEITGIVQERPAFSNIENGLGLFSSRYIVTYPHLNLSASSLDYLKEELDRNFQ